MDISKQYDLGDTAKKYAEESLHNLESDFGRIFLRKQVDQIEKTKIILDIGCGTGLDLQSYSTMGFSKLYGIDPSEKSLHEAKENISKDIELRIGTFENIPYGDAFFDAVTSRHALHYSKNIHDALLEVARVLKTGGKFIAVISHPFADHLEKRDAEGNILVTLFNGKVHLTFPLHTLSEYFSDAFFQHFKLESIYEYAGKERDSSANFNTFCFVATKN